MVHRGFYLFAQGLFVNGEALCDFAQQQIAASRILRLVQFSQQWFECFNGTTLAVDAGKVVVQGELLEVEV